MKTFVCSTLKPRVTFERQNIAADACWRITGRLFTPFVASQEQQITDVYQFSRPLTGRKSLKRPTLAELWCCPNMSRGCRADGSQTEACSRRRLARRPPATGGIFERYLHEVNLRPHSRRLHVGYEVTDCSCWGRAYLCLCCLSNCRC